MLSDPCWYCLSMAISYVCVFNEQVLSSSWDGRPFGDNRYGPKIGGGAVPLWGEAKSPCNTMWPGPTPTSISSGVLIHLAIWPQQIWAENLGACPFGGGEAGSSSSRMWPGLRPTCVPSFILIHPTVCHNTPTCRQDRQTGQDNGPIA